MAQLHKVVSLKDCVTRYPRKWAVRLGFIMFWHCGWLQMLA